MRGGTITMTENDIFRELCKNAVRVCPYNQVLSVPTLSRILNTSTYVVRKHIKNLVSKGLVTLGYDGGVDEEGYPHCYKGYYITGKAFETEIYKEEYEREMKYITELLRK